MRSTYTYAILDLSPSAFEEIRSKLLAAGYGDQFHQERGRAVIDMHGIAVASDGTSPDLVSGTAPSPDCSKHKSL